MRLFWRLQTYYRWRKTYRGMRIEQAKLAAKPPPTKVGGFALVG